MFLSLSSLINITLLFSFLIIIMWLFLKNYKRIVQISISAILLVTIFVILRLLMPLEFEFQLTIGERHILPYLYIILHRHILNFNYYDIYLFHILLFVWLVGIGYLSIKKIIHYIHFCNSIKQEPILNSKKVHEILNHIKRSNKKETNFKIIKTSLVSVPIFLGLLSPTIVLPEIELSDKELNYILRHETTHYYNHDLWIKWLVEIISIIYWWNPLIYVLKKEINKMLEIRTDLTVTKSFDKIEKINYLECLLKVAKSIHRPNNSIFYLALDSRSGSVLSQRFYIILNADYIKRSKVKNLFLIIFIVFILVVNLLIVVEPYAINPAVQQNTVEISPENSYLIVNPKGGYDMYLNNQYFGTVTEIKDSYSNLPIYKNFKEIPNYESQK